MSSRLQLDMRNLSLGRRHLVNAYEVEAGISVIAGNTVWSMPERLECEVLQKARNLYTLTFTFFTFTVAEISVTAHRNKKKRMHQQDAYTTNARVQHTRHRCSFRCVIRR